MDLDQLHSSNVIKAILQREYETQKCYREIKENLGNAIIESVIKEEYYKSQGV